MGEAEMSQTQIKAAEILLKKVAPDLARQELTGQDNGPVKVQIGWMAPE